MKKRVVFAIQGEGRGHMTQSIALKEILEKDNFEVVAAIVGTSSRREIPSFIRERLNLEIHEIDSPNFVTDKNQRGIDIIRSITSNLAVLPKYFRNIRKLRSILRSTRPDLVVNFYEPLLGLYHFYNPKKYKLVCVAHQYLTLHPKFRLPKGFPLEKVSLRVFTRLTAKSADAMLGLSFYKMDDDQKRSIYVVPPLLRPEIKNIATSNGAYLLIYILNKGYKSNIIEWHNKHPEIPIHCFSDDPEVAEEHKIDDTLTFHQLNGEKFLEKMAHSMALVSTAGFESICEAMYMGKPALMVPVQGHYEQFVNSRDAHGAGAGVYAESFDIDKLMLYLKEENRSMEIFKKWADSSEEKIIGILKNIVYE